MRSDQQMYSNCCLDLSCRDPVPKVLRWLWKGSWSVSRKRLKIQCSDELLWSVGTVSQASYSSITFPMDGSKLHLPASEFRSSPFLEGRSFVPAQDRSARYSHRDMDVQTSQCHTEVPLYHQQHFASTIAGAMKGKECRHDISCVVGIQPYICP